MAGQWCDDFSGYAANAALMLNGNYADNGGCSLIADPDGISGGHVLSALSNFGAVGARRVLTTTQTVVGQCGRLWMPSLPNDGIHSPMLSWNDGANNIIVSIGCDTTGRLFIVNGAAPTAANNPVNPALILQKTNNPVVGANAWWHIEAKMQIVANTLTWEVRVEGQTVLSGDTAAAAVVGPFSQVIVGTSSFSAPANFWKDYAIWDGSGAHNNDFLGSVLVARLSTSADVALNWTPVGGATGAAILANIPPLDGVQYIDAPNPPPAAYVGAMTDLPVDVTSVKWLMTTVRAAKVDGGDGSMQVGLISSPAAAPATVLGANRPITVAQTYWSDVFETDPKTGAAWLPSAVNAAEIQINRTT